MIERLRAWARTHTDEGRYSPVGVAFHWLMAALVLFQLGWGYWTSWMSVGGDKVFAFQVHSAAGLPILVLAVLRACWRLIVPGPVNDADKPGWPRRAAQATYAAFYVCFFGLPLSGWVMWSALAPPGPLYLAGVIPWPQLPFGELPLHARLVVLDVADDIHGVLVVTLLLLVPLHTGAALKHHFWDRDDVLKGILPDVPDAPSLPAETPRGPKARRSPKPSGAG